MSASLSIAAIILVGVVVWLALALIGAVREIAELRARVDALEAGRTADAPLHLGRGLPVGTPAPSWTLVARGGAVASSPTFAGRRHLLVFADAACRACDDLVPGVIAAAGAGTVPPIAVICRGDVPRRWRAADVRVLIGAERGGEVSDAFGVDVSPFVFLIDEGGAVVDRGPAASLEDVEHLVRGSDGVRIVAAGGA